ncbi:pyruvate dehydrogenase phosphatase regulatory subunit, mitochondrial-like isoform X2 [Dendronephthya gigantea]|uniref:pyruvate dehydrogenase phosphatase regulatory subunit, mitochondrial-like isoform X2 n=1 Tax=Dendronephthya gigantea TaxID=151771 RepID=UPI00106BBF97|nr:pyruvate dehydrogenase phosphatase regulatory subunit, mitochondrial-like isoform X2 [Dendronephthya gigantea]
MLSFWNKEACGTTWHAASLLGIMKNTSVETLLANYGVELYRDLEKETGLGTSWKQCGSLSLARTQDRLTFLKRQHGKARAFGVRSEFISPTEAGKKWPNMRTDDLTGVLWFPDDGVGMGMDITQSLAKGAKMLGVEIREGVTVESIQTKNNTISSITTNKGKIDCEIFVNCAGQWARELGLKSEPVVHVPLHSAEHFYIVTKPLPEIDPMLPVLRDADGWTYFREWNGGILAGGFEPKAKPIFYDDKIPEKFEFQLFSEDWDHFEVLLKEIIHRFPPIENAEIRQMVNGPESFTPDGKILIGEVPEIDNYYIACAMNSRGVVSAAGIGRALAEWIKNKSSTMDLSSIDIKRFSPYHNNKTYLRDSVSKTVGYQYALPYPASVPPAPRNMKSSPLYDALQTQGASWTCVMGWECPAWFSRDGIDPQGNFATFGKPKWFNNVKTEVEACTSGVGVADISATLKIEITGSSAVNLLQFLCSNNVDVPPGMVVQTLLLNPKGGIEGFSTLYRLTNDRFYLIDSIKQATRLLSWISDYSKNYDDITVADVTSHYSGLFLIGPASTELLQSLTQTSLDSEDFPLNSIKRIDVGYASDVLVARGSDEWKLFLSPEFLRNLYNQFAESGRKHNITNVGLYALNSIHIEDGIPAVGAELTQFVLPQNAGLNSLVDLSKKTEFISDLDILSHASSNKRLVHVSMRCHDDDNFPWGGEPLLHDDAIVGMTTSAACGFKGNNPVAMATIELPEGRDDVAGMEFEIEIANQRYPVDVRVLRSE